jgi:hypothetical protein
MYLLLWTAVTCIIYIVLCIIEILWQNLMDIALHVSIAYNLLYHGI